VGLDFGNSGWNLDVDGVSVEEVAAPVQRFTRGKKLQAGEVDHRAVGGVFPRNPLGIVESEVAGSGGDT